MLRDIVSITIIVAALCVGWRPPPALAGPFSLPLDGAAAYNYSGGCGPTGTHGARTVPRCSGDSDGSFYLRTFMRDFLTGPATFTVNRVRFTPVEEPDTSALSCWDIACTATALGSDPQSALTFSTPVQISTDLDADTSCDQLNEECFSDAATNSPVRNELTDAACSGTACNNAELICRVTYNVGTGCAPTAADADVDADFNSLDLTLTE
jgi:hypothetical protein